jgi:hypothetical protein
MRNASTSMANAGFFAGLEDGLARALAPHSVASGLVALVIVGIVAWAEKRGGLFGAATRTLENGVFGFILPIALLGASTRVFQGVRLDTTATPLARFGPSRRSVAFGLVGACMIVCGVLAALAASIGAIVAHDPSAPPLAVDAATCAWIGALAGSAYAALFALGSTFGARGGGRYGALVLDFVVGGMPGFAALLAPHAHARNLLGGEPPLALSQPASAAILIALAAGFTVLAIIRCPP